MSHIVNVFYYAIYKMFYKNELLLTHQVKYSHGPKENRL